ncbi:MAG: hypothetical protein RR328_02050 [Bacteroidales bacterium]
MKKLFILLAVLAVTSVTVESNAQVFNGPNKGESILGVRFGAAGGLGANISYDYALARVWKGTFTIGGYVGYHHHGGWNGLPIMLRTTYRFNVVVPEWEVYAGVMLGGAVNFWDNDYYWHGDHSDRHNSHDAYGSFAGDFILGSTYYFAKAVGVNLEFNLGSPSTWVNVGFNFKF